MSNLVSLQNQWVNIKIKQMEEKQSQYDIVKGVGSDEELEKYRQCFIVNGSEKSLDIFKMDASAKFTRCKFDLLCYRQGDTGYCSHLYLLAGNINMYGKDRQWYAIFRYINR